MRRWYLVLYIACVAAIFLTGVYFLRSNGATVPIPRMDLTLSPTPSAIPLPSLPQVLSAREEIATVASVIDGDTITLTDKRKVRYIGVDTPETKHPTKGVQCFGKEASLINKELVEGKTIRMKKDVSEADRYGRLLRYVWVDGLFVNEYLAREGYASPATFPPDVAYASLFKEAAAQARQDNKGLWSKCK